MRSLRLQEVGFARLLSLVVWLLLLLIMVPNMALPIRHVQVQQLRWLDVLMSFHTSYLFNITCRSSMFRPPERRTSL